MKQTKCNHLITKAVYKNKILQGYKCIACKKFINKTESFPFLRKKGKIKPAYSIGWKKNKQIQKAKKLNLLIQYFLAGGITGNIPVKYF